MKNLIKIYPILIAVMYLIITGNVNASILNYGGEVTDSTAQAGISARGTNVHPPTTLGNTEKFPQGLTKTAWAKMKTSIERDRYRLYKGVQTGTYQAPNYAHDLDATFTREGLEVSPRKQKKEWTWGLHLSKYGYGSDLRNVPVAEKTITKKNHIEYHRGNMVEWYINDRRGLEQGFTLRARPSGRMSSEPLQLQMKTMGNLIPGMENEGKGIIFRNAKGDEVLRYSGLYAYDATGTALSSKMVADQEEIRLIVADHEAVYPIVIDPYIERPKLLATDGAANDEFGNSVSINGDTAIVGADWDDDNGVDSGSAYIFYRDQGGEDNWGQVAKLTPFDGEAGDEFGVSVSVSGDTVIVGAPSDDNTNGVGSGSAYIFGRNQGGADNWGEVRKLIASDGAADDDFGWSVSISGDTAIVGADWDDDNGVDSGSAYIFYRDQGSPDNWGEVRKLIASNGAADDEFGISVSISGDTAIVGAPSDDNANGVDSGSAYVFDRDQGTPDNWGEVKIVTADDGAAYDDFGWSVSISGDTAIVGADWDDDNGVDSGSAYIFDRDEGTPDNWGQVKKLTPGDGATDDEFGISVSISGDAVIVGAHYDDDNGSNSGSAYIFYRNLGGTDNWGEMEKITSIDGAADDEFGFSVSISGDTAFVGAPYDDDNGSDSGSAYIYDRSPFGDELAGDFGTNGLWLYDGSWLKISNWDPDDGLSGWSGGLSVDFGTDGIWNNDGSSWTRLTSWNAGSAGLTGWNEDLAIDFDVNGLWNYNGASWSKMSNWDPDSDLTGWVSGLAVDFGTNGLWNTDGSSWTRITTWNAGNAGLAGWGDGLAADFDTNGLWSFDGSAWHKLTSWDPENDLTGWPGGLAVDFGTNGLWSYDGSSWVRLTTWDAGVMTGISDGLVVDFGANGVWKYTGTSWAKLTNWNAGNMGDVDLN